ncbi:unnamed protein product [Dracunculus medinensis]|uniref:DUF3421 domain-containing protein n=1 Tax=Dracunculus medinensis TaxID=318479 RepID=A0A0N4UQT0_DRAME|nr:unnamed protein product [Dracunculus medinensis]
MASNNLDITLVASEASLTSNVVGCKKGSNYFNEGQIWTEKHVRYQCVSDGVLKVLGCVDDGGFIELGKDVLVNGVVHRCYRIGSVTYYHRFRCDAQTLAQCTKNMRLE